MKFEVFQYISSVRNFKFQTAKLKNKTKALQVILPKICGITFYTSFKKYFKTNTDFFPRTLECKKCKKNQCFVKKPRSPPPPRVLHSLVRLACHSVSLNQHNTVYFTCSETSAESLKWRQIQLKPTTHFCCVLVWCDICRLLHWSFQQIVAQQLYKQTEPQFLNWNIVQIIHKYKWSIVILDLGSNISCYREQIRKLLTDSCNFKG